MTRHSLPVMLAAVALAWGISAPAPAQAQITTRQLGSVNSAGNCTIRPTAAGAPFYNAIIAARAQGGLSNPQVLQHAASRLGYGPSPHGPLTVPTANDCSTVFVADELARQIGALGARADQPQLTTIRRGAMPLTMFSRVELNKAVHRILADPANTTTHGTLSWEARTGLAVLKSVRELLGSQWLDGTTLVDNQLNLEEVLLELWLNHFNVEMEKSAYHFLGNDGYPEVLRGAHGTTFAALLKTVLRQPAMLAYLDNQAGRCDPVTGAPSNQNLGRELLELHTLGVGPTTGVYGQADVLAVSRALCGWNAYPPSQSLVDGSSGFVFNDLLALPGPVTVLGVTYPAAGTARVDALAEALANHASTKSNICRKLSARLYAATLVPASITACQAAWGSGGDLRGIVRALVSRPEFWRRENYRALQRTPIELVIGIARQHGFNLVDALAVVTSEGLTAAPFVPSGLNLTTANNALEVLRASRSYAFMNRGIWNRITTMLGTRRMSVAPPTGYPMDGAAFLSTGYLDDASRLGLDVAHAVEHITASGRRDLGSPTARSALDSRITSQGKNAALEWFIELQLNYGNIIGGAAITDAFVMPAAHLTNLRAVFNNNSWWAYHLSGPTSKRSHNTLIGLMLSSVHAMWR